MGNPGAVVSIAVDNQAAPDFGREPQPPDGGGDPVCRDRADIGRATCRPASGRGRHRGHPRGIARRLCRSRRDLVRVAGKWAFRTAGDLSFLLSRETVSQRRLSRAAMETLAIIAYHQPATRADIEEIRGVATSRGTLDVLMEAGWVRMRGRRRSPGRPVTYGITEEFLSHFGLDSVSDLPGLEELKGAGLLDASIPAEFDIPEPDADQALAEDEDPLDEEPGSDAGG